MKTRKAIVFALVLGLALCFSATNASAAYRSAAYGTSTGTTWQYLTTTAEPIVSYTIYLPVGMPVCVECTGYMYMMPNTATRFAIGVDGTTEDPSTYRHYKSYAGEIGYDAYQTSRMYQMDAGSHTFNCLGKVHFGADDDAAVNYNSILVILFETGSVTGQTEGMEGDIGGSAAPE